MTLGADQTSQLLQQTQPSIAIIAVGATEQCGPCLPCCVDSLLANFLADFYAERLSAYRTPLLPFNTSQEHAGFAGTLSLSTTVMIEIVTQLSTQLAKQGMQNQILLSPHGGSHWENAAIKEINSTSPQTTLISAKDNAPRHIKAAQTKAGIEPNGSIHGGPMPLSIVAFLKPELISPGSFGKSAPEQSEFALNYGLLAALGDDGCWGTPMQVDGGEISEWSEKGRVLWTTFAELQAKHLGVVLEETSELRCQLANRAT